jgi:hypothetical protein
MFDFAELSLAGVNLQSLYPLEDILASRERRAVLNGRRRIMDLQSVVFLCLTKILLELKHHEVNNLLGFRAWLHGTIAYLEVDCRLSCKGITPHFLYDYR